MPVIVKKAVLPEQIGAVALTEAVGIAFTKTFIVLVFEHELLSVPVTV